MQYLQDLQVYEGRYDLMTIEDCLRNIDLLKEVYQKTNESKEFEYLSDSERLNNINGLYARFINSTKAHWYKRKEETLAEWIEKDRKKQVLQDNTPAPEDIHCAKCKAEMSATMHHLHSESDKPDRVLFFFECPDCKSRKGVFEYGGEWWYKPFL